MADDEVAASTNSLHGDPHLVEEAWKKENRTQIMRVIMVIKLTTARIEQRFCLSWWSSWSWSSRDMIHILSGSDIIVAVPGGIRALGTNNANITQFILVGKKKVNLRKPDRAQRSG